MRLKYFAEILDWGDVYERHDQSKALAGYFRCSGSVRHYSGGAGCYVHQRRSAHPAAFLSELSPAGLLCADAVAHVGTSAAVDQSDQAEVGAAKHAALAHCAYHWYSCI